uniref:inorganic diphosphatase n=1 Tax=Ignisphaera aggregans TaxID=334771 RepID=A0A7C4JJ76_9CREN
MWVGFLKVVVVGHRNPDTDAIVSSISFSYILRCLGFNATPYRVGDIQPETKAIIEKVGLGIPEVVEDVRPRARDVMTSNPVVVKVGEPVKKAIDILVARAIRSVPIVDEELKVRGLFSVESFAQSYLKEVTLLRLNLSKVPVKNFLEVSGSKLVVGSKDAELSGKVFVAAWSLKAIEDKIFNEGRDQILVVGDRVDVQLKAVESGISVLIVTGGFDVPQSVVEVAKRFNTVVIVSPYDTYTTLRLLDLSQPVEYFSEKVVSVTEDTYVKDVVDTMVSKGIRTVVVVDSLGRLKGIITRSDLVKDYRKRIALVDHNEFSQSVEGVEESIVVAVVDHHRVSGDVKTLNPIIFRVEPLGSTNTILWLMARELNLSIPKKIAEVMLYAILSDTMLLRSPTTTSIDKFVVKEMASYAEVDIEQAIDFVKSAMALNEPVDPKDVVARDLKVFEFEDIKFGIAQIFTTQPSRYLARVNEIKRVMNELAYEKNLRFLALMITDYIENRSLFFVVGDEKVFIESMNIDLSKGFAELSGVISRKSQVLPKILEYLQKYKHQ